MDVLGDATGRDQHEAIHHVWELVGELHRYAAAERVPDDGDVLDAERRQKIPHAVGVRGYRVIRAWLVGTAVTQQVRCDDRVLLGEVGNDLGPRRRVVADSVQEQYCRTLAGYPKCASVAVNRPEHHPRFLVGDRSELTVPWSAHVASWLGV